MGLVFGAILPHGAMIPEIAGSYRGQMSALDAWCQEVGSRCKEAQPDTICIVTPHGECCSDAFTVSIVQNFYGRLGENEESIEAGMNCDAELAKAILQEGREAGNPVLGLAVRDGASYPLDWGALIPLWYCGARFRPQPLLVVATPSQASLKEHFEFGVTVARVARKLNRRVAFIASCDWAHTHLESGPYGYHEDAARLDAEVQSIVASGDLQALTALPEELIENAKIDGIWPAMMLHGALQEAELHGNRFVSKLHGYDCPTYFGMLCASWVHQKV